MTWDEIYERAEDKPCGSDELNAKDEARFEVGSLVMEKENYDIETAEIPEEEVEYYCDLYDIRFDEDGKISSYKIKQGKENRVRCECRECIYLITSDEDRFFCGCEESYQYELEVDEDDSCIFSKDEEE